MLCNAEMSAKYCLLASFPNLGSDGDRRSGAREHNIQEAMLALSVDE
jgi:hypothetical protein